MSEFVGPTEESRELAISPRPSPVAQPLPGLLRILLSLMATIGRSIPSATKPDQDISPSLMKYRPDIDGLRALAVVPVVLFQLVHHREAGHAAAPPIPLTPRAPSSHALSP